MPTESEYRNVWVYAQHEDGEFTGPTLECLAAGRKVADRLGQKLVAVVLGHGIRELLGKPILYGADEVLYCDDPALKEYLCLTYTTALAQMVTQLKPYVFLFVSDEVGKDLAPRVAWRVTTGLATDNIELEVEDYYNPMMKKEFKNLLIQIRPDFGTRVAKIYTPMHRPQMATIRAGNFKPLAPDPSRKGELVEFKPSFSESDFSVVVKEVKRIAASRVNLEGARAVVSIGLGILKDKTGRPRNPQEGYRLAKSLADAISEKYGVTAEVGASRALIYAELKELEGLISKENQVGQTGRTVSPDIYFALGISGALQHRVGMQRAKKIVAINLDPSSPILKMAHYPIVGDVYEEVPKLIQEIRRS